MRLFRRFTVLAVAGLLSCSEAPLISGDPSPRLNRPVSFVLVPGTSLAILANANVNLEQPNGWLVGVDLDTRTVLTDTFLTIPSFAGEMAVDAARSRLYVVDRGDDAVLVFQYSVPGTDGRAISFSEVSVPDSRPGYANAVRTDEGPLGIFLQAGTPIGDLILTTNSESGTISATPQDTLTPLDLFPDNPELSGLPLVSAANFKQIDRKPGRGAGRITATPGNRLLYITSSATNQIYVVDAEDRKVEAMIDFSSYASGVGMKGLALTTSGLGFVAHQGLGGVIVFDASLVTENGLNEDVIDVPWLDFIPTGNEPDDLVLSTDEKRIFVSHQGDDSVVMIDVATRSILSEIEDVGRVPGEMVLDSGRGVIYVLNFLSDNISIIDETSGVLVGTIR